jgi:D-alanyl-D-alanine dipeptidase
MTRDDEAPARVLPALALCLLSACTAEKPQTEPAAGEPSSAEPAPSPVTVTADTDVEAAPPVGEAEPEDLRREPPEGFVDLREKLPGACFDVRYFTRENFTGAPLPGYGVPGAWMLEEPAAALALVHEDLGKQDLAVLVHDAYRPLRGTLAMVAWATRTDQVALLDGGYIARRSGHNHGHTIDLSVAKRGTCEPLDMGTPYDLLDERSHTKNATGTALENRLLLKAAMKGRGFEPYSKEWWHFGFPMEGTRGRDVPYGCQEPDEGAWKAPDGWDRPGWVAPADPPGGPCLSAPAGAPSGSG